MNEQCLFKKRAVRHTFVFDTMALVPMNVDADAHEDEGEDDPSVVATD